MGGVTERPTDGFCGEALWPEAGWGVAPDSTFPGLLCRLLELLAHNPRTLALRSPQNGPYWASILSAGIKKHEKSVIRVWHPAEAIKLAPLIRVFQEDPAHFVTKVCVTAQHREMLDDVLNFFRIKPDYDLNIMKPNQSLFDITADGLKGIQDVLSEYQADNIFVEGDTTTSPDRLTGRVLYKDHGISR